TGEGQAGVRRRPEALRNRRAEVHRQAHRRDRCAGGSERTGNHGRLSPWCLSLPMSASPVMPHHNGIVRDGTDRWATRRFLRRLAGHKQGVDSLRRCARACVQRGIGVLTVFAFSSENWNRPADEVSGLMELLAMALAREVPQLKKDGVRLYFVGE